MGYLGLIHVGENPEFALVNKPIFFYISRLALTGGITQTYEQVKLFIFRRSDPKKVKYRGRRPATSSRWTKSREKKHQQNRIRVEVLCEHSSTNFFFEFYGLPDPKNRT
jgi:hypothetical protein